MTVEDQTYEDRECTLRPLQSGGEYFERHVPQSRYFQSRELAIEACQLDAAYLARLDADGSTCIARRVGECESSVKVGCDTWKREWSSGD